jgi:hypothetical protein
LSLAISGYEQFEMTNLQWPVFLCALCVLRGEAEIGKLFLRRSSVRSIGRSAGAGRSL